VNGTMSTTGEAGLQFAARFVLWDNTAGKIISYGMIEKLRTSIFLAMTKGTWDSQVSSFVSEMLADSPYKISQR
jgi:hypothetical protein